MLLNSSDGCTSPTENVTGFLQNVSSFPPNGNLFVTRIPVLASCGYKIAFLSFEGAHMYKNICLKTSNRYIMT